MAAVAQYAYAAQREPADAMVTEAQVLNLAAEALLLLEQQRRPRQQVRSFLDSAIAAAAAGHPGNVGVLGSNISTREAAGNGSNTRERACMR